MADDLLPKPLPWRNADKDLWCFIASLEENIPDVPWWQRGYFPQTNWYLINKLQLDTAVTELINLSLQWIVCAIDNFWKHQDYAPDTDAAVPATKSLPRLNSRHFPDDIFKCIFFNENV